MWYRSAVVSCESLERRALFAAIAYPSADEQLLVELINRGRADPLAEAARYGIALNEGVATGSTIDATPKQPLAINLNLTSAAKQHSIWMIDNDVFSHTGAGGSSSHQRMAASGYAFTGDWGSGENLAYSGSTGSIDVTERTARLHENLFVDNSYPNRAHRVNQMNPAHRVIGAGVHSGFFFTQGAQFNAVMATEDFARSGTNVFLTGVAYSDGVVDDDFYTVGEGFGGIAITAVRAGDNATFSTTTWSSGGYSLALPAGTYTVTASDGITLGGTIVHDAVVIGDQNVKRDFRPDMAVVDPLATLINGHLEINGTDGRDQINLSVSGGILTVWRDGTTRQFTAAGVTSIAVYLWGGADGLNVGDGVIGLYGDGGMGNDHLVGGQFDDTLTGNGNHDKIFGGPGDDRINGSGGHDKLYGETGRDRIHGGDGWDTLDGGAHIDRLFPESGRDTLFGQHGHDLMYTLDGEPDYIAGGSGWDTAEIDDELDLIASVETWY